ncbi:sugar kinase [Microbacterium sp. NM3R9]|uniref:sugar kinase n=1 Tax=Microbacterium thalli TaxID=3027921 RepID=UPI002366741D|nr:sugar kinase [Microbacterium thalli]MDN8547768.1 sugar kinase [Microbacterium thalli]
MSVLAERGAVDRAAAGHAVVTLGETMALARATEAGSLRHVGSLALGVGGAESNVAIALRRLGVAAGWAGRVGDDPLGQRVVRELRAEGVDVLATVDPAAATGLMLKERPTAATTAVYYYRAGSAGSRLHPDDMPRGWIEDAALLHVTGITALISPTARDAVHAAIQRARAAGVPVSFDINYRSALAPPPVAAPVLRELAEAADLVFGGEDELELIGGTDADAAATALLAGGVAEVIVKRGAAGATARVGADTVDAPGFRIDPVDTVGAGDAFVAGYLSSRLAGDDPATALHRGNTCGAIACLTPGDWEAAPTLREIERFHRAGGDPVQR